MQNVKTERYGNGCSVLFYCALLSLVSGTRPEMGQVEPLRIVASVKPDIAAFSVLVESIAGNADRRQPFAPPGSAGPSGRFLVGRSPGWGCSEGEWHGNCGAFSDIMPSGAEYCHKGWRSLVVCGSFCVFILCF